MVKKITKKKIYPDEGAKSDPENKLYKEFETRIDTFVKKLLSDYTPAETEKNKVIHDPVWGTMMFYPWEQQIMDSPLLQRLRRINQVGLAVLTYPSAHHSRFEHSLGVMAVVTKMVNNINSQEENYYTDQKIINNEDLYKLRLAALLHDVGHCFFSHLSESIYGKMIQFIELKKSFSAFEAAKEHEIFSYIIVTCPSFKNFFEKKIKFPINAYNLLKDIGKMIIGSFVDPVECNGGNIRKYYLTQMINGQFDADKLDYLRRDSYTAGLALTYDIERFLYKICIVDRQEKIDGKDVVGKHLSIPVTGISAVEEMVFSQLMLTSYIYQHQKVLATDALIQDVAEGLAKNEKLIHPCDFLKFCDDDIYRIYGDVDDDDFCEGISKKNINSKSTKTLSDIVKRVKMRELPKRAFAINFDSVTGLQGKSKYHVADIATTLKGIAELRQEICEEAQKISNFLSESEGGNKTIDIYDIHISIPKTSVAKDLSNAFVVTSKKEFVKLSEIVRLSDWADAFSFHKWNAYVFARADICSIVGIASEIVFEKHGISLNGAKSYSNLKSEKKVLEMRTKLFDYYQYNGR